MKNTVKQTMPLNRILRLTGIGLLLFLVATLSACSNMAKSPIRSSQLNEIGSGMSEQSVVRVLGKPDRVKTTNYKNNDTARVLYYTLDDGRKWMIVINNRNELIGSGESDSARSPKQMVRK